MADISVLLLTLEEFVRDFCARNYSLSFGGSPFKLHGRVPRDAPLLIGVLAKRCGVPAPTQKGNNFPDFPIDLYGTVVSIVSPIPPHWQLLAHYNERNKRGP